MNAPTDFDEKRTSWRSVAFSAAFHAILLAPLLLVRQPDAAPAVGNSSRAVELVLADVSGAEATKYFEPLPTSAVNAVANNVDVRDILPIAEPAPSMPTIDAPQAITSPNAPSLDAGAMTQPTSDSGFAVGGGGQFTADELKQIADERQRIEGLMPRGEPGTIRVFGSGGLTGRKFVFLIDRSKSMGSQGLGVLDRANAELHTALSQLTADHEFQIVAYNHETETVDRRALLPATDENRKKVTEFIQYLAAVGSTEHESGLIAALAFKPDIVVLMTDGGLPEMNEAQLATIRRIVGKKSQIHCIQFGLGPAPSESFMIPLAQQNGGTYKYIDVSKWK